MHIAKMQCPKRTGGNSQKSAQYPFCMVDLVDGRADEK